MRLVLAALGLLLAAAPVQARVFTIGSSLKGKANRMEAAPVDSVYWNTRVRGGHRVRAPRKGQVVGMRLKGRINPSGPNPPDVVMHLQTLRPVGGGKMQAILTTGDLRLPYGGSRQHIWSYDDKDIVNLCVLKGDYVGLSTSGGYGPEFYPNGAEFAVFGSRPRSAFRGFTGAGQDMNGSIFEGRTRRKRELLMQLKIVTGKRAGVCNL